MTRIEARLTGRVQGVGFRYSAAERARRHSVSGWVCNAPDGSVHVVAEGSTSDVEDFLEWLHRGPASAHVSNVEATQGSPRGLTGFEIRHDCR